MDDAHAQPVYAALPTSSRTHPADRSTAATVVDALARHDRMCGRRAEVLRADDATHERTAVEAVAVLRRQGHLHDRDDGSWIDVGALAQGWIGVAEGDGCLWLPWGRQAEVFARASSCPPLHVADPGGTPTDALRDAVAPLAAQGWPGRVRRIRTAVAAGADAIDAVVRVAALSWALRGELPADELIVLAPPPPPGAGDALQGDERRLWILRRARHEAHPAAADVASSRAPALARALERAVTGALAHAGAGPPSVALAYRWLGHRAHLASAAIGEAMRQRRPARAVDQLGELLIDDLDGWHRAWCRAAAPDRPPACEPALVRRLLRLTDPFAPALVERLARALDPGASTTADGPDYPGPDAFAADEDADGEMAFVRELLDVLGDLRGRLGLDAAAPLDVQLATAHDALRRAVDVHGDVLRALGAIERLGTARDGVRPDGALHLMRSGVDIYATPGVPLDRDALRRRLQARIGSADARDPAGRRRLARDRETLAMIGGD